MTAGRSFRELANARSLLEGHRSPTLSPWFGSLLFLWSVIASRLLVGNVRGFRFVFRRHVGRKETDESVVQDPQEAILYYLDAQLEADAVRIGLQCMESLVYCVVLLARERDTVRCVLQQWVQELLSIYSSVRTGVVLYALFCCR